MKTNWKKNLKLIVVIAVLLAVIYVILRYVGVPIPIKREVTASQIVIGQEDATPIKVKIDGVLRLFVGVNNRFEGSFEMEGYEGTKDSEVETLGTDGIYVMRYKAADIDKCLLITNSLFLRDFAVQLGDGVIFGDGKTVILYPQEDDVHETITKLRRKVGWQESLLTEETTANE